MPEKAGKGFAVAADEIRKLAEESDSHGKHITQILRKLKDKIKRVNDPALAAANKFDEPAKEKTRIFLRKEKA